MTATIGPYFQGQLYVNGQYVDNGNPLNPARVIGYQAIAPLDATHVALAAGFQDPSTGFEHERVYGLAIADDGTISISGYVDIFVSFGTNGAGGQALPPNLIPILGAGSGYVLHYTQTYDVSPGYAHEDFMTLFHFDANGVPTVVAQVTYPGGLGVQQNYLSALDDTHALLIWGTTNNQSTCVPNLTVVTVTTASLTVSAVLAQLPAGCYGNLIASTPINGGGLAVASANSTTDIDTIVGRVITYSTGTLNVYGPFSAMDYTYPMNLFTQYPGVAGVNAGEFVLMRSMDSNGNANVDKYHWDGTTVTLLQTVPVPLKDQFYVPPAGYPDYSVQSNFGYGCSGTTPFGLFNGKYYLMADPYHGALAGQAYVQVAEDLFGTVILTSAEADYAAYSPIATFAGSALVTWYEYQYGAQAYIFPPPGLLANLNTRRVRFKPQFL